LDAVARARMTSIRAIAGEGTPARGPTGWDLGGNTEALSQGPSGS